MGVVARILYEVYEIQERTTNVQQDKLPIFFQPIARNYDILIHNSYNLTTLNYIRYYGITFMEVSFYLQKYIRTFVAKSIKSIDI